jgi:hypothetical protein
LPLFLLFFSLRSILNIFLDFSSFCRLFVCMKEVHLDSYYSVVSLVRIDQ